MSWLPRLQIALFAVVIVGMLFLIFGHWESDGPRLPILHGEWLFP